MIEEREIDKWVIEGVGSLPKLLTKMVKQSNTHETQLADLERRLELALKNIDKNGESITDLTKQVEALEQEVEDVTDWMATPQNVDTSEQVPTESGIPWGDSDALRKYMDEPIEPQVSQLLPCPCCGEEAEVCTDATDITFKYFVKCTECGMRSDKYTTGHLATPAWNRRTSDAEIERLQDECDECHQVRQTLLGELARYKERVKKAKAELGNQYAQDHARICAALYILDALKD